MSHERPRVLLGDDYGGILAALRRLLTPSCDVVGDATDGSELLDAAARLRPDVIVLDLNMPQISGLEACRRIKVTAPETKVVLLTATDTTALRQQAFSVGASAFVAKHHMADDLLPAIRKALEEGSTT